MLFVGIHNKNSRITITKISLLKTNHPSILEGSFLFLKIFVFFSSLWICFGLRRSQKGHFVGGVFFKHVEPYGRWQPPFYKTASKAPNVLQLREFSLCFRKDTFQQHKHAVKFCSFFEDVLIILIWKKKKKCSLLTASPANQVSLGCILFHECTLTSLLMTISQLKVNNTELNVKRLAVHMVLNCQIKNTFEVGALLPSQTSLHRIHYQFYCTHDVNMIIKKKINIFQQFYTF